MMTVAEFAAKLRISQSLVYQSCKAGKIRHERYGLGRGTIRIPPEALDEYRQGRTIAVATAEPVPKKVKLRHLHV